MTHTTIIKKLTPYLTEFQIEQLKMTMSYTENNISKLVVISTVSNICKEYQSTETNEKVVGQLLVDLVKSVF